MLPVMRKYPHSQIASLWRYVRLHHAEFGVALFLVPVLGAALLLAEAVCALGWLMG